MEFLDWSLDGWSIFVIFLSSIIFLNVTQWFFSCWYGFVGRWLLGATIELEVWRVWCGSWRKIWKTYFGCGFSIRSCCSSPSSFHLCKFQQIRGVLSLSQDIDCLFCFLEDESIFHLFSKCYFTCVIRWKI